ncbi:PH domain-containing protein [Alkalibacillus aidingensis]|uniref:PH domain-containing protein n=1 Tax=Alkalibacillus aidingensis TaxID=2747607 RepID=UPI0016617556|nr:PH domain-containing protein [Alkalibacillus aidingensis]
MDYPTKKDIWIAILLFGFAGFALVWTFLNSEWFLMGLSLAFTLAVIWLWFTVHYRVDEGKVIIKYGPFTKSVDIQDIEKIRLIRNLKLSPALSVNRLEITYGFDHRVIRISPANKDLFMKQVVSMNPEIDFE